MLVEELFRPHPATWIQRVADASRERFSERTPLGFQGAPQQEEVIIAGVAGRDFADLDRTFLRFESPTAITHDPSALPVFSSVQQSHGNP